jgi:lipoate-protein ligase A
MRRIRLLDLGTVSPLRSQTCYHAAAEVLADGAPDTIILVSPVAPYVCVGYHQDLEREVDLEYCRSRGWPVYRREVGGGAVYLDGGQVFVQWVFQPSSLPAAVEDRFRLYVEPLVRTYRGLGIPAEFRPINDIQVRGKKIGGTGAATIGRAEVVVGSLMFDFDKTAMARVLKVASEKMRDKIHQSLEQYMTTMREELGVLPDRNRVAGRYLEACAEVLGAEIVPGAWSAEEEARAGVIDRRFVTPAWLEPRKAMARTGVKIHEDVRVVESVYKAPGGLIRMTARLRGGLIDDVTISGDFTITPGTAVADVEKALIGSRPGGTDIRRKIEDAYSRLAISSPGLSPEHWEAASAALPAE